MRRNTNDIIDAEGEVIEVAASPAVITAITKGEIDTQIATAKAYPRNIEKVLKNAELLATMDEDTAEECLYALKRKDKNGDEVTIEGPSVRLAEILVSCWGNCRAGARCIGDDEHFTTSQGVFFDLETNVASTYETKRRITTSKGKRYGADMIGVTSNAASSIAYRNAVFKGIPKALWKRVYLAARQKAIGDPERLADTRKKVLGYFQKLGATEAQVLQQAGVESVDLITLEHVAFLRGIAGAIKSGERNFEDVFGKKEPEESDKTQDVNAKMEALREQERKAAEGQSGAAESTEAKPAEENPSTESKPAEAASKEAASVEKRQESQPKGDAKRSASKGQKAAVASVWDYELQGGRFQGDPLGGLKAELADIAREPETLTEQDRLMVDQALKELEAK